MEKTWVFSSNMNSLRVIEVRLHFYLLKSRGSSVGIVSRGSSVGIVSNYGLNDRGLIPSRSKRASASRPALGPIHPPIQWVPAGRISHFHNTNRDEEHLTNRVAAHRGALYRGLTVHVLSWPDGSHSGRSWVNLKNNGTWKWILRLHQSIGSSNITRDVIRTNVLSEMTNTCNSFKSRFHVITSFKITRFTKAQLTVVAYLPNKPISHGKVFVPTHLVETLSAPSPLT
jgi:hypothetical protein